VYLSKTHLTKKNKTVVYFHVSVGSADIFIYLSCSFVSSSLLSLKINKINKKKEHFLIDMQPRTKYRIYLYLNRRDVIVVNERRSSICFCLLLFTADVFSCLHLRHQMCLA
jgi:hypothetical protein